MSDDNFFSDDKKQEQETVPDAPEKIKLGDKEFTQDELNRLVGLGEFAEKVEKEQNRKISEIYPEYTRKSQKLSEYEKAEAAAKEAETKKRAEEGKLSSEEQLEMYRKTIKELGFVDKASFEEEAKKLYQSQRDAEKLLDQVTGVVSEAEKNGWPKITDEDLVKYMLETGIRIPEKAYKAKFEKEIDDWKQSKLKDIRPGDFTTQSQSNAGSKQPSEVKVTKDNLTDLLKSSLYKE